MKKFLTILMVLLVFTQTAVFAYDFTEHDPFNNELFEVVGEITEEENQPDKMQNPYERDEKYEYNDGIKKDYYEYNYYEDKTYPVSALFDVNGNIVYDNPEIQMAAAAWNYWYNLGYVTERDASYDVNTDSYRCSVKFINIVTKEEYNFSGMDCYYFENDGTLKFEKDGKHYKAMLKKPAIVTVHLDGQKLYFDQIPVIEEGRTLVPLRTIFEELGATVEWNGETRTVTATKGDTTVSLTIDDTTATKNGEAITLDVPAKIENGRTLVPVRFVSDCFGVDVAWDGAQKKVVLTSK